MWEWEEAEAVCYLFALRQGAFLHLLLIIVFLLLLSGQAQWQSEGFWKDVRLPGVHWEQGEVDQLLLFVNSEEKNRKRPAWPSCSSCLSKSPSDKHVLVFSYFLLQDTEGGGARFILPEDLGSEKGVGREVITEDLVVADKVFCGLLKLCSPCDAPWQPGRKICEIRMPSVAGERICVTEPSTLKTALSRKTYSI